MIKSVGIDLAGNGEHKVRCLDGKAEVCDSFSFETTPMGLEKLEERIFRDGSNPVVVFEPTGLAWVAVAVYLRARHPGCRLVRTQSRNVAALRRYLRHSSKSDKIDAITLAKMPFVDAERLNEVYLPPAKLYAIQRLARQRKRLENDMASRKKRIISIMDGYLPGVHAAFSSRWSLQAKAFLSGQLNPLAVVHDGEKALDRFLISARYRHQKDANESHKVYVACEAAAIIYERSRAAGMIDDDFFSALQEEIGHELRLMETEEAESESITERITELYRELHPSDNLSTIPGVGPHTAPIFLAVVGDPSRFPSQGAFANFNGVVPNSKQSSDTEAKGLRMTKAGPSVMKWALYQSGQIGRRYDPQLACLYYREIVHNGKNHKQAMGAVMSHIGARILAVLRDDKPYELRDTEGNLITWRNARSLILSKYQVPEEIKRDRRRRGTLKTSRQKPPRKRREMVARRVYEAAEAPQSVVATASPANSLIERCP
jgi:transposase